MSRNNNHITFNGLEKIYGESVETAAIVALKQNGDMLCEEMKKRAPVGDPAKDKHSGQLRNSIRVETENNGKRVLVGTDVVYSRLTEFDPRQLEKHPAWAYPSLEACKKQMMENMREAIRRAVLNSGS